MVYIHLVYRTYQVHAHVSKCEVLLQSYSNMVPFPNVLIYQLWESLTLLGLPSVY